MHRTPEAACWFRLGCWSNNFANSYPSLGAFNSRVLHSYLVLPCSYPPYRPPTNDPLRIVTGCLCPALLDNLPILTSIQPTELRPSGTTLSLARRAMEPEQLLHSTLTCPSSANQRCAESHFSDSDSAPAPRFKTPCFKTAAPVPTLKIFETSTPTLVNTPKTSKQLMLKRYCLFCLMRQNTCHG